MIVFHIEFTRSMTVLYVGLIAYLRFYVPLKNISLIWRRHHCRWRAAKFRPLLGSQGLWAGGDLYRATPAVTRSPGFSGLIRRTAPFCRFLRHTRGRGASIITWILMGLLCMTFCVIILQLVYIRAGTRSSLNGNATNIFLMLIMRFTAVA
jgi:hypothetical protein